MSSGEGAGGDSSEEDPLEDLKQAPGPGPEEAGLSRRQKRLLRRLLREDEEEELFEGIWTGNESWRREEVKGVHDYLEERGREGAARRVSREWEKESRNLSLRGEEGEVRSALSRGEAPRAAEALERLDSDRSGEVWERLGEEERDQIWQGKMEIDRREAGTQAAYKALSEAEQAVAVRAQVSGIAGREDDRIAEELAALAEGRESLSEKTSAIEDALPSQDATEALRSAFEKAERIMESQSRGGGEDESQSRGYGGRGR